ncbi:MAG: phage portal protein [Candidatus Paceibacterota bacterium]
MNFITKAFRKIVKSALGVSDSMITFVGNVFGGGSTNRYSGWTYACIRAIAEELANIKLHLYRVNANGEREEMKKHKLLDLLKFPNDEQTGFDFRFMLFAHLEICGDAYFLLDNVKDEKGVPTSLTVLLPTNLTAKKEGMPKKIVSYKYREGTETKDLQKYEILHLKYPNPMSTTDGMGTVDAAAELIDSDNYATRTNKNFFSNGARLGGLLKNTEELDSDNLKRMQIEFEEMVSGVGNFYKVISLPAGTDYQEMGTSPKDMDFANLKNNLRDGIMAIFRVPKTVLGITDDVNRANAEATNYVFALRTIKPKMQMIVDCLNAFLVPRFGDDLVLDFEDPVPENRELIIQEVTSALLCMSMNEVRERYFGAPPLESGGDMVMTDFNKVPLGKVPTKSIRVPGQKMANEDAVPFISEKGRAMEVVKDVINDISEKATNIGQVFFKSFQELRIKRQKDLTGTTDEEFEQTIYKNFISRVTQYEKLMVARIKEFNRLQMEKVLEKVTEEMKGIDDDLFNEDEELESMVRTVKPVVVDLYRKEGTEALELLGITAFDIIKPEIEKAINQGVSLMSESYNKTTKKLLVEKLTQGYTDGLDLRQMKNLVKEIYDYSDNVRALQVAKTETFRAANSANKEAWKQSGVVKTIKWFTAADDMVCEFCSEMHGKVIDIEENFFNKGDEIEGGNGAKLALDYSDVGSPPLHPGCRCYARPEEISID